jgi:hypothetical protein
LSIAAAVLTLAAARWALALALPPGQSLPVLLAWGLAIAHSPTTAPAAPTNWSQRADDEVALTTVLGRFARCSAVRASLQLATLLPIVLALVANTGGAANAA